MNNAIRDNHSGWKEMTSVKKFKNWKLSPKKCRHCGTVASRKIDDPCPYCYKMEGAK